LEAVEKRVSKQHPTPVLPWYKWSHHTQYPRETKNRI